MSRVEVDEIERVMGHPRRRPVSGHTQDRAPLSKRPKSRDGLPKIPVVFRLRDVSHIDVAITRSMCPWIH
jgi:hypothetical protein